MDQALTQLEQRGIPGAAQRLEAIAGGGFPLSSSPPLAHAQHERSGVSTSLAMLMSWGEW